MLQLFVLLFTISRVFHPVTIPNFPDCGLTHVQLVGVVDKPRHEKDGDWVFDFKDGDKLVHIEIIPEFPLPVPKNGSCVVVKGIRRFDDERAPSHHRWEVHPVLSIESSNTCQP